MNRFRQMWKTFTITLILLITVFGLQIVLPICSLSILTYYRTVRLQNIGSELPLGTPTVTIVTAEREIQWTVFEQECTWKGHSYDVIRIHRSNGMIHIVAISDEEEDNYELAIRTALDRDRGLHGTVNKILAAFLLCPIHADSRDLDTVIHGIAVRTTPGYRGEDRVARGHGDVPTPPPWTWS
ncbi:MAG: hypothetical protein JSS89_10330 [Bacteroidetes bacterium]|nr:hypothetical protein [Bacteroidota bacterium]